MSAGGVILGRHYFFVLNVNISVLSPSEGFEFAFLFAYSWRVVLFPKVIEEMDKFPRKERW